MNSASNYCAYCGADYNTHRALNGHMNKHTKKHSQNGIDFLYTKQDFFKFAEHYCKITDILNKNIKTGLNVSDDLFSDLDPSFNQLVEAYLAAYYPLTHTEWKAYKLKDEIKAVMKQ